ncbi:MAG: hypothetical protein H6700_12905 [Myxococcales bacterium]|nr:hypothetical protein [Myxococcales bacterium]MCB9532660.1 hypothetical protein [Myxococcales bacterium]
MSSSRDEPLARDLAPLRWWAACVAVVAIAVGCAPAPVVSSGSSTPPDGPMAPFQRMNHDLAAVAFEFGLCEADADCAPRGCGGSICSPDDVPAVCEVNDVSECFARVPSAECGCVDGACRWARTAPVMQCSQLIADRPSNRPFRSTDPPEMYPIRLGE